MEKKPETVGVGQTIIMFQVHSERNIFVAELSLLVRQKYPFLFNLGNAHALNENDPNAEQFSAILSRDNLQNHRKQGGISF